MPHIHALLLDLFAAQLAQRIDDAGEPCACEDKEEAQDKQIPIGERNAASHADDEQESVKQRLVMARGAGWIGGHSRGLEFGPNVLERVREHLLTSDGPLRVLLDGDGQLGRREPVAIGAVLQVSCRRVALLGERIPVLIAEAEEVGSEVHDTGLHHLVFRLSTPCGVVGLLYSLDE